MSALASPVRPGEVVAGKYEIKRIIGQGGMGVVVAARHLQLEQDVAIKFLLRDASSTGLERFMREAKAAALVKSEHACRVHDFGRLDSGEPYLVMEYLEGSDLADKLEAEGPQPIESVAYWVIQACDALSSAHAQGMVHRDLKPANLFLQQNDDGSSTLKVVDFGISKLSTSAALTSTAVLMGSPLYMSPEQLASSRDVDPRSDIWSLGVVLYEMISGVPPFIGDSLIQIVVLTREREPESLASLRPEVTPDLERVVRKCLAKNALDRYPNVNALAVDLGPFAGEEATALVQKLSKRAGRSSDPRIVLAKTEAPPDPRASQKTRNDTPNSRGSDPRISSRQTPPGVDSRTPRETELRTTQRRVPLTMFGAAVGFLTLAIIGGVLIHKTTSKSAILQDATTHSAAVEPDAAIAPVPVVDAAAPPALTASVTATPTPSPPHIPRLKPSAAPSLAPVVVVTPSATASGPKRRDVDRDYQP